MPKSIGRQLSPDWLLLGLLALALAPLALLAIIGGGTIWGVTFLLDVRGHWLWFKAWRRERAIKAAGRN